MNWGNKLLITFAVFGTMISYLVYRAVTTNFELVDKEYYKNELRYQQVIDASNRTAALSSPVVLNQTEQGIFLELPAEMKNKTINGELFFYCAYDSRKDKRLIINTGTEAVQVFDKTAVEPGRYTVKINWTSEEVNYYSEKSITIH
jgi:hypothetical protein